MYPALRLDLADKIQQFLGAAYRKAGNDHIAAPVQGGLQNLGQFPDIVGARRMVPVAVGGFHDDEVRFLEISGVPQKRLVDVADVAGKDDSLGLAVFGDPQRNAGTAQQVSHIGKDRFHLVKNFHRRAVLLGLEQAHGVLGILDGVFRFDLIPAAALGFAVFPLGFLFLNVSRVLQHDLAQIHGGVRGINGAAEPIFIEMRDHARMVNVSMGHQNRFDLGRCAGQLGIFIHIAPLLHAAVHQEPVSRCFDQRTAAGDLTGGT